MEAGRNLIRSKSQDLWVFQPCLTDLYAKGNHPPFGSTIHRIERYQFKVTDPDAALIGFRISHVYERMSPHGFNFSSHFNTKEINSCI